MSGYQKILSVLRKTWLSGREAVPLLCVADDTKLSLDKCRYYLRMMHRAGYIRFDNKNKICILQETSRFPRTIKDLQSSATARNIPTLQCTNLWDRHSDYDLLEYESRGHPRPDRTSSRKQKMAKRKQKQKTNESRKADVDIYLDNQVIKSTEVLSSLDCEVVFQSALKKLLARVIPIQQLNNKETNELLIKLNESYDVLRSQMIHPNSEHIPFLQRIALLLKHFFEMGIHKCPSNDAVVASLLSHMVVTSSYKLLSAFTPTSIRGAEYDFTSEIQMIISMFVKSCYPDQCTPGRGPSNTRALSSRGVIAAHAHSSHHDYPTAKSHYTDDTENEMHFGIPSDTVGSQMEISVEDVDPLCSSQQHDMEVYTGVTTGRSGLDFDGNVKEQTEFWSKRDYADEDSERKRRSQISIEDSSAREQMEYWTNQSTEEEYARREPIHIDDSSANEHMRFWKERESLSNEERGHHSDDIARKSPNTVESEKLVSGLIQDLDVERQNPDSSIASLNLKLTEQASDTFIKNEGATLSSSSIKLQNNDSSLSVSQDASARKSINTLNSERLVSQVATDLQQEKMNPNSSIATINLTILDEDSPH